MDTIIIGIAGGTGSGKTTLANKLKEHFGEDEAILVSHDNYYKRHDDMPFEERRKLNYDHPDAFDTELMIYQLKELKSGHSVECPTYDYTVHNRAEATIPLSPAPVILVEGILLFVDPVLCDLFDIKIFVDTDADERILRRILRDVNERGRTLNSVVEQYLTTVKPMHEAFVEPSKRKADLIVPQGGENEAAQQMLMRYIENHLHNIRKRDAQNGAR
ncbi:MAG: uridine kinase [Faecalibacterium sp.]|jgi:uridine kinase|nr:uridine kinase [Faecalibacterium sp.]